MSLLGSFTAANDKTVETSGAGGGRTNTDNTSWAIRHPQDHNAVQKDREEAREDNSVLETEQEKAALDSLSDEDGAKDIRDLARTYSRKSWSDVHPNPFEAEKGSNTDPASDSFSARAWVKSMVKLQNNQDGADSGRTAGFAFRNLSAFGYSEPTDYQMTVGNAALKLNGVASRLMGNKGRRVDILRDFEGVVHSGEMLVVLGPPGSGCSTFLKTVAGETHGYGLSNESYINYQGISFKQMHHDFRGEAIYTAEQDVHFPMMTVGDTLTFAARARAPRKVPGGVSRDDYADHLKDVVMATFGIRHTINTKVGNDFVRGVSGGERKRVSIAEAALSGAPLQCWDNSTRGLDSANAIEFCKTLRISTEIAGSTAAVAIYQAPQAAYDIFDKVVVLYEGYQIYFGRTTEARAYFEEMGFICPDRQTDADFLTSMTSSKERVVREGWESKVPRNPEEFAARWKESQQRQTLLKEIEEYDAAHPIGGEDLKNFQASRKQQQSKGQRLKSPYTLSYAGQIKLCLWRGFKRLVADPSLTFTQLFGNFIMALIIGSIFYNLVDDTGSFYSRGALLFFAILINAFGSALEILTLYAQRPIVEKHTRYAFYHPSAEALASMLTDIPYKVINAITFNLALYFLTNLRREPGAFFFFLLITFTLTLVMSMLFRTIASVSRTLSQALAPAAVLILAIVIYTGFAITIPYMKGWARWINYVDPVAYGFEALMVNEFSGRDFRCATSVPTGPGYQYGTVGPNQICSVVGAVAGSNTVNGDAYIASFEYYADHKWRNYGILWVFMIGLMCTYLAAAEYISAKKSKGEVLVFRRGQLPAQLATNKGGNDDPELARTDTRLQLEKSRAEQDVGAVIQKQTAIFSWKDVCYDIKIKGEPRRILDHVDGWVKPGTMTALMGVSGAGKTTLLDVLASRVTMGVISGEMLVDGRQRDESFQRKTGYVQQQDLHLATSTVREALNFSALLRQPADVPRKEKLEYVDEVIKLLEMEEYADAVVGVPGEGLNVEQRKRLTIAVEMAAKPQLLLFLDEPTSGLDSQTSWSILDLLEKLTKNGQAILCTIHQPSAMLFQRFNRLLFLAAGGKTVYFGEIGENSRTLANYFESHGAKKLGQGVNPAEWMLEVIGAAPGSHTDIDWHQVWRNSKELRDTHAHLAELRTERPKQTQPSTDKNNKSEYREFAAHFTTQMWEVQKRVFEQYWRTPSYIYSKLILCLAVGLFIGFSFFKEPNTQQGLQNQMFGIFMLFTIFGQLVQQIMPLFVTQRSLYEARERPSKTYSWKAFVVTNILVEIPWSTLCAVILYFTWYYPIGLYDNAAETNSVHVRGIMEFLFIWQFLLFAATFAFLAIAGIDTAETGGNIANLIFSLSLVFCGVLVQPEGLPGFWIFMYRVSPFTYLIEGMLTTAVADASASCSTDELLLFPAPAGQTCGQYLAEYQTLTGGAGTLSDANSSNCEYCQFSSTNQFLSGIGVSFDNAWRDFGILWVYILVNIFGAVFIYWLARVPKGGKNKAKTETAKPVGEEKKAEDNVSDSA